MNPALLIAVGVGKRRALRPLFQELLMRSVPRSSVTSMTLALVLGASAAQAQATRTWVSGVGDDINPCSRTAPCKTFARAVQVTARGGEVSVLDAGGMGAVTITKSITIDGTASMSSILGAGTSGIIVNITDPTDSAKSVRIRGITINGAGTGNVGVRILAASRVSIEETVIDGFMGDGVQVAGPGGTSVLVRATTIRNNGTGVNVAGASQVALSDVTVIFNGTGLVASGGGNIFSFKNNVLYGNLKDGVTPTAVPFH